MDENKKFELSDDMLEKVSGGANTDDDGWYYGFGFPPDRPKGCSKCGGDMYMMDERVSLDNNDFFYTRELKCVHCDLKLI